MRTGRLAEAGTSGAVQAAFRECLSASRRRELAAVRCRDRYLIEFGMDDDSYRRLDDLSGGQRVSVVCPLDRQPLVPVDPSGVTTVAGMTAFRERQIVEQRIPSTWKAPRTV